MGLFDRLQNTLDDRAKEGGISPLDLADLPPRLRKIMRTMLREVQMTYEQIRDEAVDDISDAELQDALDTLTKQSWLIKVGQGEQITYKVNLKRKGPSALASGIWDALEKRKTADEKDKESPEGE